MSGKKEIILKNSLRLFSEMPYNRVSIRLIAQTCEVSHSLVHRHWECKKSLFKEAFRLSADDLMDSMFPVSADVLQLSASLIVSKLIQHRTHGFFTLLQQVTSTPELDMALGEWGSGGLLQEIFMSRFEGLSSSNSDMDGDAMVLLLLCTQYMARVKQTCRSLGWGEKRIDRADFKLEACLMRIAWSFDMENPWVPETTTEEQESFLTIAPKH
jgi:AcrR family transcriptional regulator